MLMISNRAVLGVTVRVTIRVRVRVTIRVRVMFRVEVYLYFCTVGPVPARVGRRSLQIGLPLPS